MLQALKRMIYSIRYLLRLAFHDPLGYGAKRRY